MKFIRAFNNENNIFSTVRVCRKRALNNKISYCVCELLPFCAFSFVRYTQRDRFVRLVPVTIFYDRCRHNLQNKMAAPEASVHPVKNRLCYHFAVCPTSESCSQRCSRRIMLLRNLIMILLASYSSKCY